MTACVSSGQVLCGSGGWSRRALGGVLVGVCLLSALAGRLVYLARPFDSDGAMFIYMGKLVCDGGRYGHDLVDNKFPTVGLMTSGAWRMLGDHWAGYVLLQAAVALGAALYLGRLAGRYLGAEARRPTLLFGLVYLNFTPLVFGGFQLETLQVAFTVLAGGAALGALREDDWRDAFVVGLSAGMAAMMKPTGLAVAGAFLIALLVGHRRRLGRAMVHGAACGAGLAIPALCVLWYLAATGIVGEMPGLWRQIARYAAHSSTNPWDGLKLLTVMVLGGFPFMVRGGIFRRPANQLEGGRGDESRLSAPTLTFLVAWLVLETVGVVAQHRMYAYHFLVMVAPLALLFGAIQRRDRTIALGAALAPIALLSLYHAGIVWQASLPIVPRLPLSDYLEARTLPGDRVWVDDTARLLLETDLRPGTRHPLTFLFTNWDTAPLEYGGTMLADFRRNRPVYLVLPADLEGYLHHQCTNQAELIHFRERAKNYAIAWREIEAYARAHYHLEARLGDQAIWRRDSGFSVAQSD